MMQIFKGDILNADAEFICHQVNCMNAMGAGVAKAIYTKYPEVKVLRRDDGCAEYELPKKWIKVRFLRLLSDEQRAELVNRMNAARNSVNEDYR